MCWQYSDCCSINHCTVFGEYCNIQPSYSINLPCLKKLTLEWIQDQRQCFQETNSKAAHWLSTCVLSSVKTCNTLRFQFQTSSPRGQGGRMPIEFFIFTPFPLYCGFFLFFSMMCNMCPFCLEFLTPLLIVHFDFFVHSIFFGKTIQTH